MLIFVHMSVYVRTIYAPTRYTSNRRPSHPASKFRHVRTFIFSFLQILLGGYCDTRQRIAYVMCCVCNVPRFIH